MLFGPIYLAQASGFATLGDFKFSLELEFENFGSSWSEPTEPGGASKAKFEEWGFCIDLKATSPLSAALRGFPNWYPCFVQQFCVPDAW